MDKQKLAATFIDNMERERTRLGYTQSQMAKALDMSLSGYKKLISGETNKIDLCLGCRLYELTGRYLIDLCGLDSPALELEKRFPELSKTQIEFVTAVVKFEADFAAAHTNVDDYVTLMVPTGNLEDGMIWDSVNLEKINVAAYRSRFGDDLHCAVKITSNHLHPAYHVGDVILISKKPPRDGDVGIFVNKCTGRAYLRKLYQTIPARLVPVNGYGQEFLVNSNNREEMDQWITFGKVLAKMR